MLLLTKEADHKKKRMKYTWKLMEFEEIHYLDVKLES